MVLFAASRDSLLSFSLTSTLSRAETNFSPDAVQALPAVFAALSEEFTAELTFARIFFSDSAPGAAATESRSPIILAS